MPWEEPLFLIAESLCGPVARMVAIILFVALGLGVAFTDGWTWWRSRIWLIPADLSVALFATQWLLYFSTPAGLACG